MKRISGNMLALIGLILGLASGLGIVTLKRYLISEIVQALNEEVVASCKTCSLTYDTFELSFLTLSGVVTDVNLLDQNQPKLHFDNISATFSIGEILDKKIYLETLVLADGHADGVGPDSATFKFIEQLTSPLPPELQHKDRWRAILNTLEIRSTSIREPLGENELYGDNLTLFVKRIDDKFALLPTLRNLHYRAINADKRAKGGELDLGPLAGSIVIEDGKTSFNSISLGTDRSSFTLQGTSDTDKGDALSGTAKYEIAANYLGLPAWLAGSFKGSGDLRGTLGSPIIVGAFNQIDTAPLTLAFPHASPIQFTNLHSKLSVDVNHGDPIVTLSAISAAKDRTTLSSTQPLTYSDAGLRAAFDLSIPSFSYGPFSVSDASAKIQVTPRSTDTISSFNIKASDFKAQSTSLGPVTIDVTLEPTTVSVKINSTDARFGSLSWEGAIDISSDHPQLRDGRLLLNNYRYPTGSPADPNSLGPVAISANISLNGPVDLALLNGEGVTSLTIPALGDSFVLIGKTTLKDGVLNINLPTSAQRASANLKIDVAHSLNGKLQISIPRVPFASFVPEAECGTISAALDYNFSLAAPLGGSGNLNIGELAVGCEPYVLRLPKSSNFPIVVGALKLKETRLSSGDTSLILDGSIGLDPGFDLSVSGDLYLSSLLPLLPSVDNLRGLLSSKVKISGALSQPRFNGSATLSKGELDLPSPDIGANDIKGRFTLFDDTIKIEDLSGAVNSGSFALEGTVIPADITRSRLSAQLHEVTIEPMRDASINFSGKIGLGLNQSKHQVLSGDIAINFAEVSKDFDLNKILLQTIKGYFIPSRPQAQSSKKPLALDLDVKLSAPRNIFVLTPFFSAELNANVHATGSTTDPSLNGTMQLLGGWVGLKGNRFDVTAGSLTFKPGSLTPNLELASEGNLRAPTGESVLVILEASGPLTSPRITLSSDRGLSQEDLLLLLTSSRSLAGRTLANQFGNQFGREQRYFLSQQSLSSFEAFFSNLTQIDTLSFEPTYNPFTGLVEPAVMAKKNFTPRFALVGSSLFSSVSNSKAGVTYNLSPDVDVNGFIQSVSNQDNIILSSDLTYTIWSEQASLVEISIEGLEETNRADILNAARISSESRIQNDADSLATIQRNIQNFLRDQGHLASQTVLSCQSGERFCSKLKISITEGPIYRISSIRSEGDSIPEKLATLIAPSSINDGIATASTLQEIERSLVLALRNEGYIAARISPRYVNNNGTDTVDLVIKADLREPISFNFSGNKLFSNGQLLDSIELFSRKRPFGNNTIKLLVQNIEEMYQSKGYLFAQVSYSEDRSNPSRIIYNVAIAEEARMKVRTLSLEGNDSLSLKEIQAAMRDLGYTQQIQLLNPNYAIPSNLEALKSILETIYQQQGFPNVQVNYTVETVSEGSALDIKYSINERQRLRFNKISISNFPQALEPPALPTLPASLPTINVYIHQLIELLQGEGFLYPNIDTEPSADASEISLVITPGKQTVIQDVVVDGLQRIDAAVANKYISLKASQPYRISDVNVSKRELLKSGLFSRVEIIASDGNLDSDKESITVRLAERALEILEVGTGANSEFGVHLFGEAVDKSLFADGRTISTRIDTYLNQARINPNGSDAISQGFANLRYTDPFFMDSSFTLTEEIRFQRQQQTTQEFNLDRLTFASYLFQQLGSGITFTGGHSLTLDNLDNVTPGAIITDLDQGSVRLSFLSGLIKFDRRDDPLVPRQGYTFTLEPRVSLQEIGSQANFASILAKSTGVIPLENLLSPRFSLGLGISAGIAQPWGDTTGIPITQRYYLGGRTTVRGFKENSLGPRGGDNAVIGGDTLLAQKNQLQYLVTDSFSTHAFVDVGNVYLRHQDFNLSDLRSSTGVGFQYISPIGPIGFDVGCPLDHQPNESAYRIHFSVGSAF